MRALLLGGGGAAVVLLTVVDVLITTLRTGGGAGPVSRRALELTWRGWLWAHRRERGGRLLSMAGPVQLVTAILGWVLGLWAGWSMIFLADEGAVVDAQTGDAAGVADGVYFAGFSVFTLGVGDFVASSPGWRVLVAVASFNGLFLVTLGITYLLSVVSAVVARRALAVHIHILGRTSEEIIRNGWTGEQFSSAFVQHLVSLAGQVTQSAEQHLAYPVLHYFYSDREDSQATLALACLEDALLLARCAVAPSVRPPEDATGPVRRSIDRLANAADVTTAQPAVDSPPPAPCTEPLRAAGIPLVDEEDYARQVAAEGERRSRLRALVLAGGGTWPQR